MPAAWWIEFGSARQRRESGDPRMLYRVADLEPSPFGRTGFSGPEPFAGPPMGGGIASASIYGFKSRIGIYVALRSPFRCVNCSHDSATGSCSSNTLLGPSKSFAFAVSRQEAISYTLEGRQKIESAVAAHLRAIKEKRDGRAEARTLYRLLLEPVALLRQNSRLIIVPDGKLNMAALGASIDPNGRFAIETHVISYSPSATAFYLLSEPRPSPKRIEMLGVGGELSVSVRRAFSVGTDRLYF